MMWANNPEILREMHNERVRQASERDTTADLQALMESGATWTVS